MNARTGSAERQASGWRDEIQDAWEGLPKSTRDELTKILDQLPGGLKGWRELLDHATRQIRFASGSKQKVAIVGPANAGKSTLFNALIRPSELQAPVSAIPGTTRQVQEGDAGLFSIVDTPGTDVVGDLGVEERQRALNAAAVADVLIVLFDASHGVRAPEKRILGELLSLDRPTVVALNKMDLVRKERAEVVGKAAAALGLQSDQLIPISALKEQGLERLLKAVAEQEPEIVGALGAALPAYRWKLAQVVIGRAASAAAAVGLTPLPFLDFIPLIGLQVSMVLAIARIYSYRITLARARELLATLGMGALGRTLFYELSKLGGPPSWLLAAGVAAGTTGALGYGSAIWFERGEKLTGDRMKAVSRAFSEAIIDRLRSLGRRRTKRASMRERIYEALEELPTPEGNDPASMSGEARILEVDDRGEDPERGVTA